MSGFVAHRNDAVSTGLELTDAESVLSVAGQDHPARVLRLFQRRDLLDEPTVADVLTWQAAGGFSLDASVRIRLDLSIQRDSD